MSCLRHARLLGLRSGLIGIRGKSDAVVTTKPTNVRRYVDELNPIPSYDYDVSESFPVPGVDYGPAPKAQTGVHAITGEVVVFPYQAKPDSWKEPGLTITDMVEVIDKNTEKGPIDMWLDGFEFPDLPKGSDQVYKVKGTGIGERGPFWELFEFKSQYPAVAKAHSFWKQYGTIRTDYLPEEQFDAMWIHFFSNPLLDAFELRRGVNIIHDLDIIPEPVVVESMLRACRRLNQYPLTVRIFEGIKDKIPHDPQIYQWMVQELTPVMEELGVVTPDTLGLHIAPDGKGPLPY